MESIRLPIRLKAIADMIPECESIADIGCDHGYLPIYLVQTGRVQRALAMDVNPGPLEQARMHIGQNGLQNVIECRLSNGFAALAAEEVQVVTIAGMGGMLIAQLMDEAPVGVLEMLNTFIVQPQTEVDVVRRKLHEKGFKIDNECMIYDRGKRYTICKAVRGEQAYDDEEYAYGRCLYQNRDAEFKNYLEMRAESLQAWMQKAQSEERRLQLEREWKQISELLNNW